MSLIASSLTTIRSEAPRRMLEFDGSSGLSGLGDEGLAKVSQIWKLCRGNTQSYCAYAPRPPLAPPALERPDSARIISSMTPGVKMAWPNSVTGPLHYYNSTMIYLERSAALPRNGRLFSRRSL